MTLIPPPPPNMFFFYRLRGLLGVEDKKKRKKTTKTIKQWSNEAVFCCDQSCVFYTQKEPRLLYKNKEEAKNWPTTKTWLRN